MIGSYARVVPTVVFQGTDYPVVAPINGDLVVQQWMQTDHLASHEHYDASFANPSHIITASPPASHPYIERSWNDSAGHEVQEYWVAAGASHVWTGGKSRWNLYRPAWTKHLTGPLQLLRYPASQAT